ncbi:hypothetical protein GF373_08345 [bacterium]|nr:hypothetical protein [bacterium]
MKKINISQKFLIIITLFFALFGHSICVYAQGNNDTAPLEPVYFQKIKIGGFWKQQFKRLTEKWIPHCIRQMEEGGDGEELLNLIHTAKALQGQPHGEFTGRPWSDAYVYNTVESICLALAIDPAGDKERAKAQAFLREKLEEWIPIILAAQCDDGYIHSYHIVNQRPRYKEIHAHEFYVQGYFLEMGIAHYKITGGKDLRLYKAAKKCADHLCDTFGPTPKRMWIHGHPGMGYALCRFARLVNNIEGAGHGDKYFKLAKYLLDNRHKGKPSNPYHQTDRAAVDMREAMGHAVRATYFYTAMAHLAMLTHDTAYQKAVDAIWDNAIHAKHYITGGVGSSHRGEAFGPNYDLRNNGYCESCAACGLTFWADRMHRHHRDAHFIDVQERSLYNAILGAIELTGERFYYQNPLASNQSRYAWHNCPCCVGNIPRALIAIKDRMYSLNPKHTTLYINHYIDSEGTIPDLGGQALRIRQKTDYPWEGRVALTLEPKQPTEFTLKLRIPDRTESDIYNTVPNLNGKYTVHINNKKIQTKLSNGYATIKRTWKPGDRIDLALPIEVQRVYADERVKADRGRVALQRGPLVYNLEDVDNDDAAQSFILSPTVALQSRWRDELLGGVMTIEGKDILAVPNFVRLNRGGWSQVWIIEKPKEISLAPIHEIKVKPFPRPDLESQTIDKVVVADTASEKAHQCKGSHTTTGQFKNRYWRHAVNGGWFGYDMAVDANSSNALLVTYWGSDSGNRKFSIFVDGKKLTEQTLDNNQPGKFFDAIHPLPKGMIKGKQKINIRFNAQENATAGGIFDLRVIKANP